MTHLPVQETRVRSLVWEDSTRCAEQLVIIIELVLQSLGTAATEARVP